jgi:ribonuclease HI
MPDFDALAAAAFHNERVAARRRARTDGQAEAQALLAVLEQSAARAGLAGLDALLAARAELRQHDADRREAKALARAEWVAARAGQQAVAGWRAWFDGSATPNPGLLGIGALLCGPAGERLEISRRAGHGSSSEAEYCALIALLEAALATGASPLAAYGDSRVVIDDVNAPGTQAGAKGLETHRARARELMAQLGEVTLRWLPRHRNGAADHLSQQAIAGCPSAAPVSGASN